MRRIIKERRIVEDDWLYPGEDAEAHATPADTHVVLPSAEYLAAHAGGSVPAVKKVGVRLSPADRVEDLVPHLQDIALITVEFPGPGEGRGYTQARLLRERHGYRGELRAVGKPKRDQMYFLARCGFDAFDLAPEESLEEALAELDRFSVAYQPTTGDIVHPAQRAHSDPR